jgi:taurine dioxygenase
MRLEVRMALGIESGVVSGVRSEPIHVIPTRAALGAEVHGIDLKNFDDTAFTRVLQAWHDHSVLLVRGQTLSNQDLIAFSRRFGDLDWAPIQETGRRFVKGLPEIYIVSNVKVKGEPIGSLGDGEAVWHTDMSYLDVPPKASMLYALEVPPNRWQYLVLHDVWHLRCATCQVEGAHRGAHNQARRHLQQRWLCAPGHRAD